VILASDTLLAPEQEAETAMSYPQPPKPNPYAAPETDLFMPELDRTHRFAGYAGFWRRFAAHVLDNLIFLLILIGGLFFFGVVLGVIGAVNGRAAGDPQVSDEVALAIGLLFWLCYLVAFVAYYAGMESSSLQATLGKMALGIKVTDLHGRRISFLRAFGRLAGKMVSYTIFYIGFIMAAFTERKQALHDMMAGTLVVKIN
jgi:uncharacterized RDD family membrane protein YckC